MPVSFSTAQCSEESNYSFMIINYELNVFCRKEVKDPDLLYNMLKNLLAQVKVRNSMI